MKTSEYILRGGVEGRERLRTLSRVMRPTSLALLQRAGIRPGMACLEIGCGGGDLAFDMARMTGASGGVVGTDFDQTELDLAKSEAATLKLSNVEFRLADITESGPDAEYDLVHARFLLTHLPDPAATVAKMWRALRPGGVVVVEDIDFRGHFSYPESASLARYVELYMELARRGGRDPIIGPRLPALLVDAGFQNVQMNVVQPAGFSGDVKLMTPLTMESIGDKIVAEGLASSAEVANLVTALYDYARTPGTIGCLPRVVEAWGYHAV
jgi:ubiquinone/menaquinone biosynthesis C-methylase UbiE